MNRRSCVKRTKIFFLNFDYYLAQEIPRALQELDVPFLNFQPSKLKLTGAQEFLPRIMQSIIRYEPDLILTINSLGLDHSGNMADFLNKAKIPLIVWFLDSPDLFIDGLEHIYPQNCLFFSCDPHASQKSSSKLAQEIHYLPLAADKYRIKETKKNGRIPVSFVGDTWTTKIAACHKNHNFERFFLKEFKRVSRAMADNLPNNGYEFIRKNFPGFYEQAINRLSPKNRNGLWHLVYWQANKYYRQKCVKRILQFNPLLAGDKYWKDVFRNEKFEYHPPIGYGEELFKLYALSTVNFASSSVQMAGAVTQRVFDVPAAGGFVLTDRREQLQEMFEVGREVICYENLEQIKELIERYLFEDRERVKIIKAARRRIAAEHTYTQRLQTLLSTALQSV